MLFIFGDPSTQIFSVFKVAVRLVPGVELAGLDELAGFLERSRGNTGLGAAVTLMLMGCNFGPFTKFWREFSACEDDFSLFLEFKHRALLCCDSVKPVWATFIAGIQDNFSDIHILDTPVRADSLDVEKYNFCVGLPIGHLINTRRISKNKMRLFTFAGSLDNYPERKKAIEEMWRIGIRLQLQSGISETRHWDKNPYENYIDFLLHSIFTLNFPNTTNATGGAFQLKGRFWEAMAVGTVLIEKANPLNREVGHIAPAVNYSGPADILELLKHAAGMEELIELKRESIAGNSNSFEPLHFFRQFHPHL